MTQDTQQRWSIDELLPGGAVALDGSIARLEGIVARIEEMRPLLAPGIAPADFSRLLVALEEFAHAASELQGYGELWFSGDLRHQPAQAFLGRVEQVVADLHNRVLFFSLWWRALDADAAARLTGHAGGLRYYLAKERLMSRHTLSEPEEKVVNLKDVNGVHALVKVYDLITNKFSFTLAVDGETKTLTRDALAAYVRHPSPQIREAAYREQYRAYRAEAAVLGQIYVNRVRDWAGENLSLRSFRTPIDVRNLANDLPEEAVSALLRVCEEQAPVFQRYFGIKAGWLGTDKLKRFDLYAPVSGTSERRIPFDEAVETVMEGFSRFSSEAAALARRVFASRHIDSGVRDGKRGGAFCYSVAPERDPWVLINYTGEPREVATLAHELGHALHSLLARGHSVLTFQASLPLAETASVFSEMLLTDLLLERETDAAARRDLIAAKLDDIYATVLRQAFFVLFERQAHHLAAQGATVDEISAAYLENLRAQFGDAVEVDEIFRHEWITIPHIYHVPFYCYAYSFGMLLSLSLYRRYQEQGAGFAPGFLRLLAHGGAAPPEEILKEAGVDMRDPGFWRGGFRVIEEMIAQVSAGPGRLLSPRRR
ncbi:MAG: M3 family oligoendopeptidase [Candidatus Methylomirabilia bacterium]